MNGSSVYQRVKTGKGTLSEQMAHQILELIASNQLVAGDRLPPMADLCEYLGVSRTSLREAIKLLDAWGAIEVKHGVGTFVAENVRDTLYIPIKVSAERSEKTISDLHVLRKVLEPEIAAMAAKNAGAAHLENLRAAVEEMDGALDDPDRYIEADLDFHSTLAEAAGNQLFLIVIRPVIDLLQDARCLAISSYGAGVRAQNYHRLILERVIAGDEDKAREAMASHLDQTWQEIEFQLQDNQKTNEAIG